VLKHLRAVCLAVCLVAGPGCASSRTAGGDLAHRPRVYAVRVSSVDGHPTANRGSISHPACTLQFGAQVARVWLAHPSRQNAVSPIIVQADEETLKDGVLLERSWQEATIHKVTDAELESGIAVVYIPSIYHLTTVELSFEPVGEKRRSEPQDDLAKGGPRLDEAVARRDVRQR
jgi:hypothetical protein